jgi:hypothetical protein
MSIRAREKALVLADTFEKDFYNTGVVVAKVSGLAFLMIGSLVTYTQLAQTPLITEVCEGQSCNVAQVSGAVSTDSQEQTDQTNYVELLSDIPDIVEGAMGIAMRFSSAQDTNVYVRHLSENGYSQKELTITSIGNNKYEATIDPTQLSPDQYEMMVTVQHVDTTNPTTYSLGYFAVLGDLDSSTATTIATTTGESTQTQDQTNANVPQAENEAESQANTERKAESTDPVSADKDSTSLLSITEQPVTEEDKLTKNAPEAEDNLLRIATGKVLSGLAEVLIDSGNRSDTASFYIRPMQTLNTQTVGQAVPGVHIFKFDTRRFPDGQYQLYAESQSGENTVTSNTISFSIQNAPVRVPEQSITSESERVLLRISDELGTADQAVSDNDDVGPADFNTEDRARALLAANSQTLDELFQRYAVAEQSGDPALIHEAKKAIQNYKERLLLLALNDERNRLFAKELEVSLETELNDLIQKVQTFEAIRKERTETDSTIDTDGDGISDFDEITLYKTDPNQADSDNDGFTDGAEIIKGFNPNDAAAEAAIVYQSPKESAGVVKTQKLQVSEVQPEVKLSANGGSSSVRTLVKGRGLPNSFVTLYIFSTPTVVTVRTEADGTFEYTFTKELEDGQHEVFVALTDNAGVIVAQSEPYTFVKEAEAFTPVDAQELSNTLVTPNSTSEFSPYQIVLGMSVFALGILLVLLGVGLRGNKPDTVILQDKPA